MLSAAAVLAVGGYAACDGSLKAYNGDNEATRLHPRERETYNSLRLISNEIGSAISDLNYTPQQTQYYQVCNTAGKCDTHIKIIPAVYPKPNDAKSHLSTALKEYSSLPSGVFSQNEFKSTLIRVNDSIPNEEIHRENREAFENEMNDLQDALDKCGTVEKRYESIIYRETGGKILWGIVEAALGGFVGIPVGLYLLFRSRRNSDYNSYQ